MKDQAPPITLYKPRLSGGRWVARADVNVRGQRIELQAVASDKLFHQARDWYNRAAHYLGRWATFGGPGKPDDPGKGVFSDLPQVCHELLTSAAAVVHDDDVAAAADLYFAASSGDPSAQERMSLIEQQASHDRHAYEALGDLYLIDCVLHQRDRLPLARICYGAAQRDPDALKVIAAMREVSPCTQPVQIEWNVDEYISDGPRWLCGDVIAACHDEIGARLINPRTGPVVHHVRPGLDVPMLRMYQAILARWS
jgi:hypothetical protein